MIELLRTLGENYLAYCLIVAIITILWISRRLEMADHYDAGYRKGYAVGWSDGINDLEDQRKLLEEVDVAGPRELE